MGSKQSVSNDRNRTSGNSEPPVNPLSYSFGQPQSVLFPGYGPIRLSGGATHNEHSRRFHDTQQNNIRNLLFPHFHDNDSSSDESSSTGRQYAPPYPSWPAILTSLNFGDIRCPICHKTVPSDDAQWHFVICLTKPRVTFNDEVLTEDKGECAICFEDMCTGNTIARLPCLCIYHKTCIEEWFLRKQACPEHPMD